MHDFLSFYFAIHILWNIYYFYDKKSNYSSWINHCKNHLLDQTTYSINLEEHIIIFIWIKPVLFEKQTCVMCKFEKLFFFFRKKNKCSFNFVEFYILFSLTFYQRRLTIRNVSFLPLHWLVQICVQISITFKVHI